MDRLSILISMLTGAVLTGTIAIIAMTLGYYNWYALGGAAVVGFVLAWPVAFLISRTIKDQDPTWTPPHDPAKHAPLPPTDAKEV